MSTIRYLTVEQRVMNRIKTELESINVSNGYGTNVSQVMITRELPQRPDADDIVYMFPVGTVPNPNCNSREYQTLTLEVWFFKQRLEGQDMEYTTFGGDIRRALSLCSLEDTTHPQPHMTGIFLKELRTVPMYDMPGDQTVAGMIEYEVEFWSSVNDYRLWDDVYDNLVEIEE
jgi:hypothetical protein